ncbi:hypothetical protein FALB51S_01756 [Frigidibacter albus]
MADVTQMLHRLGRLLDDEAQAIRAGDLQTLALLPLEKAALVSAVEACAQGPQPAQPGEAEMLTRLRQQATVNQQTAWRDTERDALCPPAPRRASPRRTQPAKL